MGVSRVETVHEVTIIEKAPVSLLRQDRPTCRYPVRPYAESI